MASFFYGSALLCKGDYGEKNLRRPLHTFVILPQQTERSLLIECLETPFRFVEKNEGVLTFRHTHLPYLLKIVDQGGYTPRFPQKALNYLPPFEKEGLCAHFRWKRNLVRKKVESFQLAETLLKAECGIVYMKLNYDSTLPNALLIDGLGIRSSLPLINVQFALQKEILSPLKTPSECTAFLKKTLDKGVDDHIKDPTKELGKGASNLQYRNLHTFTPLFSTEKILTKKERIEQIFGTQGR
jgi:hypothetical protein